MSKKQFLKRYSLIINKLRKKASSFEEIQKYLAEQSINDEENYEISIRTFQREIKEIASTHGIEITYNRSQGVYEIIYDGNEDRNERLMESFEIIDALKISNNLSNHLILEKRKPLGTTNMNFLIHAIKNRNEIRFSYSKYWTEELVDTQRKVQPLALKEARYRWYLVAKDLKDNRVKTFGLDRITNLEITNSKFEIPENYNPEKTFRYSFGIINEDHKEPQKIVLSFSFEQGKYIKSLPLHHSQKELINDEKEYRVELLLHPTYDFVMELLSIGAEVKVLEPESLKMEMIKKLEATLKRYE
ncbi:helix-turn-helix transcriptional regulator [Flavobacterium sp. ZB4R12]|uniref:helix-turn-helix transcriptional regulator n=1 Tax=Flavobacterium sp. ZB4R12 TaxID=3398732 RepID=UPI003AAA591C